MILNALKAVAKGIRSLVVSGLWISPTGPEKRVLSQKAFLVVILAVILLVFGEEKVQELIAAFSSILTQWNSIWTP